MTKGGGGLSQKVTKDDEGGGQGLETSKIGWHNMWTAPNTPAYIWTSPFLDGLASLEESQDFINKLALGSADHLPYKEFK